LSRSANPRVVMQSCQVCADNADAPLPVAAPAPEVAPSEIARLLAVDPLYPPSAAASGTAGFVEVGFTVTDLGHVENASVTAAEPPGVFDAAALAAIARWRYTADEGRAPVMLTHRFDFKAEAALAARSRSDAASAETVIDALIARSVARSEGEDPETGVGEPVSIVRNHCIREQLSYDFGEMVEIGLMNTCSEPLIVYACAEGMGRYQRRWVCESGETTHRLLVRPGDRLAGNVAMIEVPEGMRSFTYAENIFVTRPPNTEYWWLACGIDDAECRGSGGQWARSMDGKAASVDPQLWTQQSVARSY
jgi:protein TonB